MEAEPDPGGLSVTFPGPANQRQGILSCPTPWRGYQHPCQSINDRDRPQTQRVTCLDPPSGSLEPLEANACGEKGAGQKNKLQSCFQTWLECFSQ